MVYFLFVVLAALFAFSKYTKKRVNPFKLTFVFGKKGSGKSTYMVQQMHKYAQRGWIVYTDMKDCIYPGARIINADDLSTFTPVAHSAVFLDEVGITFDNRQFKTFSTGLRDWFKFQRKYKVRVIMNSQSYDVDKKIRDCVDSMVLMTSIANTIGVVRPIHKTVTLTDPSADSESRIAERLKFGSLFSFKFIWLPRWQKYFDSFNAPPREEIPYTAVPVPQKRFPLQGRRRSIRPPVKKSDDPEQ